eukprot:CAMPEP_0197824774 /NCGR_PEP_ID=MMETSP1437-20131217/1985_1 /TAXON_ID=49252 ORGANISM="Eucampia antarctica, Strain CCMP1452" /NCGR_SAMPLE_ID=MMETSP1437 /ASSEMBLY_ACC=CAM_ASM_001096 /LENGTH=428 /DNA_ID=CAMNT_0043424533 /DNA_START=260 /DNA_END=1543 /DNA_ORIENTATION=-
MMSNKNSNNNNNSKDDVCWGIVGLGDVCTVKAGPAFVKCDGSRLVAVMRRTPGAAEKWIRENDSLFANDGITTTNNNCRPYDDLDAFLKDPEMTAVYIATPPESHLEVARKVAEAGKVAYVEKPVGRCAAETKAIIDAFQKHNVPIYTAYTSRAYARTQTLMNLLQEGVIGNQVTSISYKLNGSNLVRGLGPTNTTTTEATTALLPWRVDAKHSGGGLIMDVGCHLLDRLDYLFGPLVNVTGKATSSSKHHHKESNTNTEQKQQQQQQQLVEDYVEMQAVVGSSTSSSSGVAAIDSVGAKVDCVWDFSAKEEEAPVDELVITGNGMAMIKMAGMSPSLPIFVVNSTTGEVVKEITSFDIPQHAAQPLIQTIVDELRNKEGDGVKLAPSRADNALRTSIVLDTILSSYYGGRETGYWDRPNTWPGQNNH